VGNLLETRYLENQEENGRITLADPRKIGYENRRCIELRIMSNGGPWY
jgi:hypothetical protein